MRGCIWTQTWMLALREFMTLRHCCVVCKNHMCKLPPGLSYWAFRGYRVGLTGIQAGGRAGGRPNNPDYSYDKFFARTHSPIHARLHPRRYKFLSTHTPAPIKADKLYLCPREQVASIGMEPCVCTYEFLPCAG